MKRMWIILSSALFLSLCPSGRCAGEQINAGGIPGVAVSDGAYMVDLETDLAELETDKCVLTVKEKEMTLIIPAGKACSALFFGDALSAEAADDGEILKPVMNQTFSVTVEKLDTPLVVSVLDSADQKWHQGSLTVLSGQIPEDAFCTGDPVTAEELGLTDGRYTAEAVLHGGSGKASISSPAVLEIKDGLITAEIIWSSSHYDYMLVDGIRYDRLNQEGNSVFLIPAAGFDADLKVTGDTLAMSRPHEIEYTLRFDSRSIKPLPEE